MLRIGQNLTKLSPRVGGLRCTGRAKSEHAGHLAAFDSQLTIVHAEHVAVFTVNNGPLYIGRYLHLALHFLILDYVIASNNRTLRSTVLSSVAALDNHG